MSTQMVYWAYFPKMNDDECLVRVSFRSMILGWKLSNVGLGPFIL